MVDTVSAEDARRARNTSSQIFSRSCHGIDGVAEDVLHLRSVGRGAVVVVQVRLQIGDAKRLAEDGARLGQVDDDALAVHLLDAGFKNRLDAVAVAAPGLAEHHGVANGEVGAVGEPRANEDALGVVAKIIELAVENLPPQIRHGEELIEIDAENLGGLMAEVAVQLDAAAQHRRHARDVFELLQRVAICPGNCTPGMYLRSLPSDTVSPCRRIP